MFLEAILYRVVSLDGVIEYTEYMVKRNNYCAILMVMIISVACVNVCVSLAKLQIMSRLNSSMMLSSNCMHCKTIMSYNSMSTMVLILLVQRKSQTPSNALLENKD